MNAYAFKLSSLLAAAVFVACVAEATNIGLPEQRSRAWLVVVHGSETSITALDSGAGSGVFVVPQGPMSFVVSVTEAALIDRGFSITEDAIERLELFVDPGYEDGCQGGVIERRPDGSIYRTHPAKDVASLKEVTVDASPPSQADAWPPALEDLVLVLSIVEPCQPMAARLEPFGAGDRLIELGDFFPDRPLTTTSLHQTNVRSAEYFDDDHVLLAFIDAIVIVERGRDISEAVIVDNDGPLFPMPPSPENFWQVQHLSLEPTAGVRRRAHGILHLVSVARSGLIGAGVVRFTVTATSVSRLELVGFVDSDPEVQSEDNLRRIATSADGGLAVVGRNLVGAAAPHGQATISPASRINGTSVVFFPPGSNQALIQGRSGDWWVGDATTPDLMTFETNGNSVVDSGGTICLMPTEAGMVPVASTETGDLWRRDGPGDWRKHDWWIPEEARSCTSPEPVCGRPVGRPFLDIIDQAPIAGGVVHSFERCNFVFLTLPGTDTCSQFIPIDWDRHRLVSNNGRIVAVDARAKRAIFAGDGGLLLELIFD